MSIEVRKWTTVDVYYNSSDYKLAEREARRLERLGYEFQQTDDGGAYHEACDQYIKNGKTRII